LPAGYLKAAREATRAAGALLILDEVQSGVGRTGNWFAFQGAVAGGEQIVPDAMTLAKGLGGGFPIGALVTFGDAVSGLLTAGQHGTTFGGNPVATAAALATLHSLEARNLLRNAADVGAWLREGLAAVEPVAQVRGEGLLIGFDLAEDLPADIAPRAVEAALEAGFIINAPGPRTLRLAPPLILTRSQAASFLEALPAILAAAKQAADSSNAKAKQ
jgi:acetylornithine aminotransferase